MAGITDIGAIATNDVPAASYFNATRDGWLSFLSLSTYTPTISQGVTTNIAKTTTYASYVTLGKIGILWVRLALTAGGTAGSTITVSTPWTMATAVGPTAGGGYFYDLSTTTLYNGSVRMVSTTTLDIAPDGVGSAGGAGLFPNVAVAAGDLFTVLAVVPLA